MPEVLERTISFRHFFYHDQKCKKKQQLRLTEIKPNAVIPTVPEHVSGKLSAGVKSSFSVNGQDIALSDDTWIFGELRLGSLVQVHGNDSQDGVLKALKVIVL